MTKNETKHTPGPWFTRGEPSRLADGVILVGREGENLALVETRHGNASANAHLIAAAPELLAALREMRGVASSLENGDYVEPGAIEAAWEAGDRAIAKALGEDA